MITIMTPFEDPAEAPIHAAFTQAYYEALRPRAIGVYSNFLEDEGEARIHEAYPALTYRRLEEVKRDYDPGNLADLPRTPDTLPVPLDFRADRSLAFALYDLSVPSKMRKPELLQIIGVRSYYSQFRIGARGAL